MAIAGLIASLYTIISLVFLPISFGVYQIRIAEALTVLPFLFGAAIPGLYVGCLLANIFGGMGWLDILFGPLITLVAAGGTYYTRYLNRSTSNILASVPIFLMWLLAVYLLSAFTLEFQPLLGIGLSVVATAIMVIASSRAGDRLFPSPQIILSKLSALVIACLAVRYLIVTEEKRFIFIGAFLLIAALIFTMYYVHFLRRHQNLNFLLAPLPPVILNAFGVSLYLAPLLEFNYWFTVQMIGVGELIACYAIGIPLLIGLKRRKIFG